MNNLRYNARKIHELLSALVLHYISHSKYEKDWTSVPHSYDFTELAFIESGFFAIENSRDPVAIGDLIIIPPNTHHTELSSEEAALAYYFLGLTCQSFPFYSDLQRQNGTMIVPVLPLGSRANTVHILFSGIFTEIWRFQKAHEAMIQSLLLPLIVFLLCKQSGLRSTKRL